MVDVTTTVGECFAAVAARFPDRVAVRAPSATWTYAELAGRVARIAGGLRRVVGPRSGQPVALLADHDGPLVAAVLGVISAGQVVVILDPAAPAEQTAAVLAEARPRHLLHDELHAEAAASLAASDGRVTTLLLDELAGEFTGPEPLGWRAPLMLAFTSGTSGVPKGAIINHGVLLNLVRGATDALGLGPDDTMPMLFPTSLAVAAYPMFLPLLNGGTLSTLDVRSVGLAPVADFLADEGITLAYMAPTVVRFLVDALSGRDFPALRMIALGGELVDPEILKVTADLFGVQHVAVGYGTTETGVVSLAVYDAADLPAESVHCGYAVDDVDIVVLDEAGAPAEVGTAGEVAVVSEYLFDGYWGHPELNRRVLSADPRGSDLACYRTGDIGRIDEHGALTLLGRLDTKVKVRGRFVVLGDVEADLHELPEVADAAVTARTVDGVTELVAHVVPAEPGAVDGPAIRAALLERREAYRVPSRWVLLDELPRLPNGKTDRRALPDPDVVLDVLSGLEPGASVSAADHAEARESVRTLWESMLPVGPVGDDEDFMELGGDSLLAAQMLVLLERRTGVAVPMGELVHARTVRTLAEVVVRLRAGGPSDAGTAACVQHGDLSRHPRLWFVHDLQGSAYRVRHLAAELGGDQPVWSFESPLLAGEPNLDTSLETFAARYVTDLLAVQPEGPYHLAGYSFGGICAYEMARQLRRDGHEVAFVGVVDVGPGYRGPGWSARRSPLRPWFGIAPPPPDGSSVAAQFGHYRRMFRTSRSGAARHLMVRSGLARLIDPIRFRADLRRDGRVRPDWRLWYAWEEHWQLAARHWDRSSTYPGRVDLFWADDSASSDATMGWGPLVGELHVHRFAGDHEGILEPTGARALARSLRRVIDTLEVT
jgi:acyl-coenzyme A synthetase/AMP-(fatty) acid ligase/thioesterase domain-containing protein/acyl carrier protein